MAIYNAIKRHAGPVTVWIDGIAASAASYIAMAGDEIVMPENAFLMIHDPAGLVMGTADDMRAMAEALDKIKGSLVQGYAAKSGRTPRRNRRADGGGDLARRQGRARARASPTRIAEPVRIAARFDIGCFRNAPPALVEAVEHAEPDSVPAEPETVPDGNGLADDPVEQSASRRMTRAEQPVARGMSSPPTCPRPKPVHRPILRRSGPTPSHMPAP